jgi:uncharacterized protein
LRFLPLATVSIGAVAATLGAARLLAGYVVKQMTEATPTRAPLRFGFTPFDTGVSWEEVSFPAEDGTQLGGWLLTRTVDSPAILACGGYRARRSDLLGISSSLWRAGFNVLMFDYRGYGEDPGPVTLGYRELADARSALAYLRRVRPQSTLGAIGFSMGAAVAIMLAAQESGLRALVADSPFTSQREIIRVRIAARVPAALVAGPLMSLVVWLVNRRLSGHFGFSLDDVHPLRDVQRIAPCPLLLIHGEADDLIPVAHAHQMVQAARSAGVPVEEWLVPDAGHCGAYFIDRNLYCTRVTDFFRRALNTFAE